MLVYIVTIDEVFDGEAMYHKPFATLDESKAREHYNRAVEEAKNDYKDFDYGTDGESHCTELYKDGEYNDNHCVISLEVVELE